jgi:5-hydroxyisourate hydrolase
MSPITTHVLDTALGKPAAGVPVQLSVLQLQPERSFRVLATGTTNGDGRITDLLDRSALQCAVYRLCFDTATYFAITQRSSFYPAVEVLFEVRSLDEHYHVPLLLSPFGYSTYRGS